SSSMARGLIATLGPQAAIARTSKPARMLCSLPRPGSRRNFALSRGPTRRPRRAANAQACCPQSQPDRVEQIVLGVNPVAESPADEAPLAPEVELRTLDLLSPLGKHSVEATVLEAAHDSVAHLRTQVRVLRQPIQQALAARRRKIDQMRHRVSY